MWCEVILWRGVAVLLFFPGSFDALVASPLLGWLIWLSLLVFVWLVCRLFWLFLRVHRYSDAFVRLFIRTCDLGNSFCALFHCTPKIHCLCYSSGCLSFLVVFSVDSLRLFACFSVFVLCFVFPLWQAHLDMVIMGIRNLQPYQYLPMQLAYCVFEVRSQPFVFMIIW